MLSFEYNGQSTKTILDTPLMVVQFDVTNDITGFSREIVKGEKINVTSGDKSLWCNVF